MTYSMNTETASTKELVEFYNKHAHELGKREVKKFVDRATAQLRVRQMVDDLSYATVEAEVTRERRSTEAEPAGRRVSDRSAEECHQVEETVEPKCPRCGSTELYSGHGKPIGGGMIMIVDEEYVTGCHVCGHEVDSRDTAKSVKVPVDSAWSETREAMKTSLKLDRTIVVYEGEELQGTWSNAFRMWKDNPEWMTSGQQDRLTAKLYAAAKQGEKIQVEINGRTFELVNV